jgi:hypothetical protein
MSELYLHSPNTSSWHGAQLKEEAQGQLYLLPLPFDDEDFSVVFSYYRNHQIQGLGPVVFSVPVVILWSLHFYKPSNML